MPAVLLSSISVFFALLSGLPEEKPTRAAASTAAVERIAEQAARNEQAFSTFSCRFKIALGTSPNVASALRDGPIDSSFTAKGRWTVKDKVTCYEVEMPDEEVRRAEQRAIADAAKNGTPVQLALPPFDIKVIGNGQHQWVYIASFGQLRRSEPGLAGKHTPFDMGSSHHSELTSPVRLIQYGLKENHDLRLLLPDAANKHIHQVELVEPIQGKENEKLLTSLKFDADRGFLATEVSVGFSGKRPGITTTVTSAKQVDQGAWYPERTVQIEFPAQPADAIFVREIVVTDMRMKVADEELQITVPRGTVIVDGKTVGAAPIFAKDTVIKSNGLEQITSEKKSSKITIIKGSDLKQ